jgi:hypothetical protein
VKNSNSKDDENSDEEEEEVFQDFYQFNLPISSFVKYKVDFSDTMIYFQ